MHAVAVAMYELRNGTAVDDGRGDADTEQTNGAVVHVPKHLCGVGPAHLDAA